MDAPAVEETIVVPATVEQLDAIHTALDRFWSDVAPALTAPGSGEWWSRFVTAVAEIASNIVRHAYPLGRKPGLLRLRLCAYPGRVEAYFDDHGVAFTPAAPALDAKAADSLALLESGRGLAIARAYLDELDYRRTAEGTNEWHLVKRFAG